MFPSSKAGLFLLILGAFLCLSAESIKAQSNGLQLEKLWEKNIYSAILRAPLKGAVGKNGSLMLGMSQGREAVLLDVSGNHLANIRADKGSVSNMVSITDIGYDPHGESFWIWSKIVGRLSHWDTQGNFLGTSKVDQAVNFPGFHGARKVYLRRPDQGSPECLFTYDATYDEEILIWQPLKTFPDHRNGYVDRPFTLGKQRLGIVDQDHLVLVHLNTFEDDWRLPLPTSWRRQQTQAQGDLSIQSSPNQALSQIFVRGGLGEQVWLFRKAAKVGYDFAVYDGLEGELKHTGLLEDLPLAVGEKYIYFVDVLSADELILRKVRLIFGPN